jgi:nucleoside-diphosphate-sugar epimerase
MEGKGKSVLIIGGTGLLGYHAGLELLRRGYEVTALAPFNQVMSKILYKNVQNPA